tara:strand:- start:495 stop:671 length:177 start_codon:yes stop_codon:yes gene_type:complete
MGAIIRIENKEERQKREGFNARIREIERMCAIYRSGLASRQETFQTIELNIGVLKNTI